MRSLTLGLDVPLGDSTVFDLLGEARQASYAVNPGFFGPSAHASLPFFGVRTGMSWRVSSRRSIPRVLIGAWLLYSDDLQRVRQTGMTSDLFGGSSPYSIDVGGFRLGVRSGVVLSP